MEEKLEKIQQFENEYYTRKMRNSTCNFCGSSPANYSAVDWTLCDSCCHSL